MSRRRLLLPALAVGTTMVAAAPAEAVLLKGTVSGAPYVATSDTTAVPVIFSKQTAKRAGLQSPVGVIVIPRRKSIPSREGKVSPSKLRLGDRFRFDAKVSREAKKAVYTRLGTKKLFVYKRSKTLSTFELEAMIKQLQTRLTKLEDYTRALSTYTIAQVTALRADLNALRADLEALRGAIKSLEGLTAELKSQLDKVTADLAKAIADLANLTKTVGDLQASVAEVQSLLLKSLESATGRTLSTVTGALADLANIQAALAKVKAGGDYVEDTGKTLVGNLSTSLFGNDGASNGTTDVQGILSTLTTALYGTGTAALPQSGTYLAHVNTLNNVVCNDTNGLAQEFNALHDSLTAVSGVLGINLSQVQKATDC